MRPPPRMMSTGRPILYELDARSWLDRLSRVYARRIQLGNVPDEALEPILATGCGATTIRAPATDDGSRYPAPHSRIGMRKDPAISAGPFHRRGEREEDTAPEQRMPRRARSGCVRHHVRRDQRCANVVPQATDECACARHPLTDD